MNSASAKKDFFASTVFGHVLAAVTICIWAVTYIATKVLLTEMTPTQILVVRFSLGYLFLWVLHPHRVHLAPRQNIPFFLAGLSGVAAYYLLEHIALQYTQASNVGVIIATAPFFTALLLRLMKRTTEPIRRRFLLGFVLAMAGIAMLSFGGVGASIHLFGDLLALIASFCWGIYAVYSRDIAALGISALATTRRIFLFGLCCLFPISLGMGFTPTLVFLHSPALLLNLLFLALVASALCFASWNKAVSIIGAEATSVYIYLTPVVTVVSSVLFLAEKITPLALLGIILTLLGLVLSEQ